MTQRTRLSLAAAAIATSLLLPALPAAAQGRPENPGQQGRERAAEAKAAAEKKQAEQRAKQAEKKDMKAGEKAEKEAGKRAEKTKKTAPQKAAKPKS